MAEILTVPEYALRDVIAVIKAGLNSLEDEVPQVVRENLERWCSEEEDYLNRIGE